MVAAMTWASLAQPGFILAQASLNDTSASSARCATVQAAVKQRAAALGQQRAMATTALQRLDARLTELIGRADARGYAIGRLQADQAELERRAAAITADYTALATAVTAAADQCGADGSLAPARAKLVTLRADVVALQTWRQATLATDLHALAGAKHS
jgi:hypothetical protein